MIHRRTFLKTAALGGTALSAAFRNQASASRPKNVPGIGGIRLAIATICMDGFGDENFEPSFRLAPKIGFKNIEFNCWYPRNLTLDGIRSIARRCKAKGLTPVSVQGNGFGDGKTPDVSHKIWCMQAAKMLGCNRVKFTGSKRGTNGGLPAVIGSLKELAPVAEELGMLICVENHANNNLENIADYEEVFAAIDSPNVGMCLDAGHFDGAAVGIPEVIEKFHSRIVHVDLKDCQTFGTYKTVSFGEGITDLHGMIQQLTGYGYEGYLVVEQAPPIVLETLEEDLRRGYEMFKKYER